MVSFEIHKKLACHHNEGGLAIQPAIGVNNDDTKHQGGRTILSVSYSVIQRGERWLLYAVRLLLLRPLLVQQLVPFQAASRSYCYRRQFGRLPEPVYTTISCTTRSTSSNLHNTTTRITHNQHNDNNKLADSAINNNRTTDYNAYRDSQSGREMDTSCIIWHRKRSQEVYVWRRRS